jgi:hypothetical protein
MITMVRLSFGNSRIERLILVDSESDFLLALIKTLSPSILTWLYPVQDHNNSYLLAHMHTDNFIYM